MRLTPNLFPTVEPKERRLAVVGESPGEAESSWRRCSLGHGFPGLKAGLPNLRCWCGTGESIASPEPFCGPAGDLLNSLLKDNGLRREEVFLGNVSQLPLRHGTLRECLEDQALLAADLERFQPNAVLCLGSLAIAAFHPQGEAARVSRWRGSIFSGMAGVSSRSFKCVCANNPAAVLYTPSDLCLLRRDVARAVQESSNSELLLPERRMVLSPTFDFVCQHLDELRHSTASSAVGFDIEGGPDVGVTVLSIAIAPSLVFSIPFKRLDWSPVWSPEQEAAIWARLKSVLENPTILKVGHNIQYERHVLSVLHGIKVWPVACTMLAWHVCNAELDKGLDIVASVLTREPSWGDPGDWPTDEDRDRYNCLDSAVCLECWLSLELEMTDPARAYYDFLIELLEPTLEAQLRGVLYDAAGAKELAATLDHECLSAQGALDAAAGIAQPSFDEVADLVCHKRDRKKARDWPDLIRYARPSLKGPL